MHYVVGLLNYSTALNLAMSKTKYGYHGAASQCTSLLSLGLLGDLALNASLQCLALVVLELPALLLGLIASKTSESATNGAADTVADALAQVADLTLSLLGLSVGVLLLASLAQTLKSQCATESLLASTDSLVPRAGVAVRVVLGNTLCADRVATDVGTSVRDVLAGVCLSLLLLGLVLATR